MKTKITATFGLAIGLLFSGSLTGTGHATPGAIAQTDADQIVRAAIVTKYPGMVVKTIASSKTKSAAAVRNHRYDVVVIDGKTQLHGTVFIDLRAWSPRAGIDRVNDIRLRRPQSEVAQLDAVSR